MVRRSSAILLCMALLLATRPAARAGSRDDSDLLGAMPKAEKDVVAQLVDCARQLKQMTTIKNTLARKDVAEKVNAAMASAAKDLNATLMTDGLEKWVGKVALAPQGMRIELRLHSIDAVPATLTFSVPYKGLSKEVLESAKKLQTKEAVIFSVARDAQTPARCRQEGRSPWLKIDVPGPLLTAIGPAGSK